MQRLLVFSICGARYALRLSDVGGVSEEGAISSVPGSVECVVGLADWRGGVVTVLDVARLLARTHDETSPAAPHGPSGLAPDRVGDDRCLVRLAPPLDRIALRVPGPVRVRTPTAPPHDRPVEEQRPASAAGASESGIRLLDPEALVAQAEEEVRRAAPDAASGGWESVEETGPWT